MPHPLPHRRLALVALCALQVATGAALAAPPGGKVAVGPGVARPLYPVSPEAIEIPVARFLLDVRPVTVREFEAFVAANPRWRRDRVPRLLADEGYLADWEAADLAGDGFEPTAPVTRVSWFAARAFCEARGDRLPLEAEWELAAAAGDAGPDGAAEPGWTQRILDWYATPASRRPPRVASNPPNHWGVHDLHGLVWEWVEDFGAAMVTGDRDAGPQFCGAGATGSARRDDYAAFMRLAFRSALKGASTTSSLGFRCARSEASP